MTRALNSIIQPIGLPAGLALAEPPEWIHLMPVGTFSGVDGRGPYEVVSAEAVASSSMASGRKLAIDINHSIDLRSSTGDDTPARGWIVAMEARADGIWGKVEWTSSGRWAVGSREYGFISPVFTHTKEKPHQVFQIVRAALTNDPNLTLTALHTREDNAMLEQLRKALGLPDTANEAAVLTAVTAAHTASQAHVALMAKIVPIAGTAPDANADAVVTALQAKVTKPAATGDAADEIETLKGQVTALHNQLTGYVTVTSQERAAVAIDKAIADGKVFPVMRDHYIARHVKDAAEVDKEITLLPSLHVGGLGGKLPPKSEAGAEPDDQEKEVMVMMGVDPTAYAATRKTLYKAEG